MDADEVRRSALALTAAGAVAAEPAVVAAGCTAGGATSGTGAGVVAAEGVGSC